MSFWQGCCCSGFDEQAESAQEVFQPVTQVPVSFREDVPTREDGTDLIVQDVGTFGRCSSEARSDAYGGEGTFGTCSSIPNAGDLPPLGADHVKESEVEGRRVLDNQSSEEAGGNVLQEGENTQQKNEEQGRTDLDPIDELHFTISGTNGSELIQDDTVEMFHGEQIGIQIKSTPSKQAVVHSKNRIGVKPEGWFKEIAILLQCSITATHASDQSRVPDGFEAPEPDLFARARRAYDISEEDFRAMGAVEDFRSEPTLSVVGASDAAGKSGAFFFLTEDQSLIAKTCTVEDWQTLLQILPDYVAHLEVAKEKADARKRQCEEAGLLCEQTLNGFIDTLLPRFMGLYAFNAPNPSGASSKRRMRVVVMANVFAGARPIQCKYDLKGSTHGRKASKKERKKKSPVLKDLDWLDDEFDKDHFLSGTSRALLVDALREDANFLATKGLIDYSLLVGIHSRSGQSSPGGKSRSSKSGDTSRSSKLSLGTGSLSMAPRNSKIPEKGKVVTVEESDRCLYIGIVDILTSYQCRKRAETFCLGDLRCGRDISCQPPRKYADRFFCFMDENVFPLRLATKKSSEIIRGC